MLAIGAASGVARLIWANTGGRKKTLPIARGQKNNIFFPIQATCDNI